jgi:WXG100 family type VII secretion target
MPSFVHTKVDPDQLSAAAGHIENSLRTLENAFRAVDAALREILYPTWKGPASSQFFAQYAADVNVFASQLTSLRAFNGQLKEAAGIFDDADAKARDEVNKLRIE